jgi:hypothetical protein
MIYTSVSFVGSTALSDELMLLGKKYATGVIVTQVVPAVDGHSSLVLDYKSALAKYFPGEAPDYVSLEGYVDASVLIAALQRNGAQLDTEGLVGTLENLRDLDVGLGTPVIFSRSDHQGVHRVWGTQLDEAGHYQPIDLQKRLPDLLTGTELVRVQTLEGAFADPAELQDEPTMNLSADPAPKWVHACLFLLRGLPCLLPRHRLLQSLVRFPVRSRETLHLRGRPRQ